MIFMIFIIIRLALRYAALWLWCTKYLQFVQYWHSAQCLTVWVIQYESYCMTTWSGTKIQEWWSIYTWQYNEDNAFKTKIWLNLFNLFQATGMFSSKWQIQPGYCCNVANWFNRFSFFKTWFKASSFNILGNKTKDWL